MSDDPSDDATLAFGGISAHEVAIPGYRIVRQLGHGGMGAVYLAEDEALGRRVAIKVVAEAIARDAAVRARFLREARLLATVEHPNVVRVYSFGASEERAYLVMEYVEGETLADRIQRGPLPVDEAKAIALQVVDALDAAWEKQIVHRDIKPSNILFNKRGNLKVADFGLAKGGDSSAAGDSSLTQSGYLLGSPHYVAPEQAQGHESGFRADIYSLGVTLFEMLTGSKPFEASSALAIISRHLHDEMPRVNLRGEAGKRMADLVAWMTRKAPEERPQSYAELREALVSIDGGTTTLITKRRPRTGPRPAKMLVLFAAAAFAIAAVALNFVFWRKREAPIRTANDDRLVVAVAPFWGPDAESSNEGKSMAALVQQQIVTRLGSAAKVIGIEETKEAVRDADSARALGERFNATAVIWGQAFALRNEREIQPSLTLVSRKSNEVANVTNAVASLAELRSIGGDLPAMPEAIRVEAGGANQLDMRKSSAESIGDLVTFIAAMQALRQNEPQRALELLAQTRKTPDALYQKAVCLANMKRDDDAARELHEALKLDPAHAPSLAMLADIDARASRYPDAAAHLRTAAATGRRFTTAEAALYNGTLYVMERYVEDGSHDTATMLAIDPAVDRVLNRWELPGPPRVFSVDDAGMTVKVDLGPPRTGELMTLHFAGDRFTGRSLPHVGLIGRIRRMKAGWGIAKNFNRESGRAGLLLPISHFRYSPIDADPTLPSTLPDLKAALENAIARDPTQPWYPMFLALTTWELGDRVAANRIIDDLFAKPYAATPYYEYSWMARMFEPYGHRDWADRAYAEALKRRRAEAQPIVMTATIERMLDAPFIRRAAYNSIVSSDPPRDHLWLTRAREITGLSWDGDEISSAAWARYFREHGDPKAAAEEERVHQKSHDAFGGVRESLTAEDLMRALSIAGLIAIVIVAAFSLRRRDGIPQLPRQGRIALSLLAIVIVIAAGVRLFGAARTWMADSVPVPIADSLTHPVILTSLEDVLAERDSNELRFITGVAQHLAGNTRRAAELYASVPGAEAAENLNRVDQEQPANFPRLETWVGAFHRVCPYAVAHAFRAAWGPRPPAGNAFRAAVYEASQMFYLALLLAVTMLLLAAGAAESPRDVPALTIAIFVLASVFALFAISAQRTWSRSSGRSISGMYGGSWSEQITTAAPLPPDPAAEASVSKSLTGEERANAISQARAGAATGRLETMRAFWIAVALAALAAVVSGGLLVRDALRRRAPAEPLLDRAADMNA